MTAPIKAGDKLTCIDSAPDARLTAGKTYMAQWARPDGSYVSVVNDEGRLTQYAATRFSKGSLTAVRANALIPFEPGQWVLAFNDPYGPWPRGDLSISEILESLQYGGAGWEHLRRPEDQFAVRQASRVMPKTYTHSRPSTLHPGTMTEDRHHRENVVAAASSAGELLALRDKLFAIGFAADRAIEEETARRMADFERKTRAAALAEVHAALPHIFGRSV